MVPAMNPEFFTKCVQEAMQYGALNLSHSRKRRNEADIEGPVSKSKSLNDEVSRRKYDINQAPGSSSLAILCRPIPIHPGNHQNLSSNFGTQMGGSSSSDVLTPFQTEIWNNLRQIATNQRKTFNQTAVITKSSNTPDSIASLHASEPTPDIVRVTETPTQTYVQPPLENLTPYQNNMQRQTNFLNSMVPHVSLVNASHIKMPKNHSDKSLQVRRPVPFKPTQNVVPYPITSARNPSYQSAQQPPIGNFQNVGIIPSFSLYSMAAFNPSFYQGNHSFIPQPRQEMLRSGPPAIPHFPLPVQLTALQQLSGTIQNQQRYQNATPFSNQHTHQSVHNNLLNVTSGFNATNNVPMPFNCFSQTLPNMFHSLAPSGNVQQRGNSNEDLYYHQTSNHMFNNQWFLRNSQFQFPINCMPLLPNSQFPLMRPPIHTPFMAPLSSSSMVNEQKCPPVQSFAGNMASHPRYVHNTSNPNVSHEVTSLQVQTSVTPEPNPCFEVPETSKENYVLKCFKELIEQNCSAGSSTETKEMQEDDDVETEEESDTSSTDDNPPHLNMKLVNEDELNYLHEFFEDVDFIGPDERMKQLRQRTFMKLLSSVCQNEISEEVIQKCFDIVLRKTLSMANNVQINESTNMYISIHHASLNNVPFCLEGVRYESFNGTALMTQIKLFRNMNPQFCFNESFRVQVDVGEIRGLSFYTSQKKTYVLHKTYTFLRAVAIALSYNRQVNGDKKYRDEFRRIITENRYQAKAARDLQKLCSIDKNDIKFGYKMSSQVAEHLPTVKITILSRKGIKVLNENSEECITLSEIRGKFDAVLPS